MMDEIRLALIGTGQNMKGHLRSLTHIEGLRIAGMADVDEERLAEAAGMLDHETSTFTDYRRLLDEVGADAALIAVPNYLHRQVTCDCLDAGLHVLCEKPMATTLEDCDAMIEAAQRNDRILEVGLSCRFSRIDGFAHEVISRGAIGRPTMIWCKEFRGPFARKYQDWILDSSRSGGTLVEKTCHHFDLFNWFSGANATRVWASGGADGVYREGGEHAQNKEPGAKVDVLDNAFVTVDYDSGLRANLALCMFASRGRKAEFGIIGTEGQVVYYRLEFKVFIFDEKDPKGTEVDIEIPEPEVGWSHHGQAYREQLYFLECVREGGKPKVDGAVGKNLHGLSLKMIQVKPPRALLSQIVQKPLQRPFLEALPHMGLNGGQRVVLVTELVDLLLSPPEEDIGMLGAGTLISDEELIPPLAAVG